MGARSWIWEAQMGQVSGSFPLLCSPAGYEGTVPIGQLVSIYCRHSEAIASSSSKYPSEICQKDKGVPVRRALRSSGSRRDWKTLHITPQLPQMTAMTYELRNIA